MKAKNKTKTQLLALVVGLIVSSFFLLAFGPKFIGSFIEKGVAFFNEIGSSFITWDDPNAFFITYFVGYILVWWRPLWGSIIMMASGVIYVVVEGFSGPPIFAAPAFIVGLLYLLYYLQIRKTNH